MFQLCRLGALGMATKVRGKQSIAEFLLPRCGYCRNEPFRIGDGRRHHDVDLGRVIDLERRKHVGHGVQRMEAFVDGNLEGGR